MESYDLRIGKAKLILSIRFGRQDFEANTQAVIFFKKSSKCKCVLACVFIPVSSH